ncbi:hypothetical protein [Aquisphaera insulae]|uniref:hypothetical protein n=1 Tax=Aquisphaera insulae TaxID=2712864 RepID=UPI0013ED646C|nr:hypothetical protein [Aquisphaera insulae]
MRRTTFGFAAIVAGLGVVATAKAQSCPCEGTVAGTIGSSTVVGSPIVGGSTIVGDVVTSVPSAAPGVVQGYGQGGVYPYSYWVAPPGQAREYVPYSASGTEPFPFYGRAYGSPGDRWSWYYMGGGDNRYLARYYYQLLR